MLQIPANSGVLQTQCNAVVLQQMAGVLYFDSKGGVRYPRLEELTFSRFGAVQVHDENLSYM